MLDLEQELDAGAMKAAGRLSTTSLSEVPGFMSTPSDSQLSKSAQKSTPLHDPLFCWTSIVYFLSLGAFLGF